jgi:hypothetical protein
MLNGLLTPPLAPFAVALGIMLFIALTEAVGTLFGASPSSLLDQILPDLDTAADIDMDVDGGPGTAGGGQGMLSQLLGWLCIGKVPILILLVAFLTAFGLAGILFQSLISGVFGAYLPALFASIVALILALPPTRWFALGLARLMPKEETEAVSSRSFVGRVATITRGIARRDIPAEAKLRDVHGQMHYVLVEPDADDAAFQPGAEVLLISQSSAIRFRAIPNENVLLSSD